MWFMELELLPQQHVEQLAGITLYQASIDRSGQITLEWSDSCANQFERPGKIVWDKPPEQLFGAAFADWWKNARRVIRTGEPCAWDHKMGDEGQLLVRHRLMRLDEDKVFGVVELRGSSPEGEKSPRQRMAGNKGFEYSPPISTHPGTDHFLAAFSHEIHTPMNAILCLSRKALKTGLTSQQREYIGDINVAAQYLMNILQSLLQYFKVEAGKVELESVPIRVPELFAIQKAMFGASAQEKGLELSFGIDEGIPEVLHGDSFRISEVLSNFLSNSLKFTHHGGVYVRCQAAQQDTDGVLLRFEVRDTGIGMTAKQQEKVFDAFYQAESSENRQYGGSGLGLFISRGLVEKMGGTITMTSAKGQGTLMAFTCRMALQQRHAGPENERALTPPRFSGESVLVVDDTPLNQEVFKELLEEMNLKVVVANNGQEALDLLEKRGEGDLFSLVLMDLQMPVLDGYQAAARIRKMPALKSVPIIAISASCNGRERKHTMDAGMNECLNKPVEVAALYRVMRRYLKEDTGAG